MAVKRYNGTAWVTEAGAAAPLPSGMHAPFAGSTAPVGWLLSDGSAVSRTTYSGLFAAIGTTYGIGDNSTTFNLPNLKGRAVVGVDAAQTEFDALGETGGAKTHTLTESQMPSHTHIQDQHTHIQNAHSHGIQRNSLQANSGGSAAIYGLQVNTGTDVSTTQSVIPTNQNTTATNQNTGGGGAHNNLQPYIAMNYIIKV